MEDMVKVLIDRESHWATPLTEGRYRLENHSLSAPLIEGDVITAEPRGEYGMLTATGIAEVQPRTVVHLECDDETGQIGEALQALGGEIEDFGGFIAAAFTLPQEQIGAMLIAGLAGQSYSVDYLGDAVQREADALKTIEKKGL